MLKTLIASLVVICALGCGSNKPTGGAQDASPDTPPSTGTKLKVVYIPKSAGNPYFTSVQTGFEKAAKEYGFDFTLQAPTNAETTSQLGVIQDQVQQKVDVIAISPNSNDALNEALDQASKEGILVITVDADLTGNEAKRAFSVLASDSKAIGEGQLELMGKLMNYEGDFAILSATSDAPNQNAWIAALQAAMKDPKYAKMKLVATVYGDDEMQKSTTEAEGLFSKYPNLKGILSPTSVGLAAAAQVLETAGVFPGGPNAKNGGVFLTGLSTPDQMRASVEKGVVISFQLWSPEDMGYAAGYLASQVKQGKAEIKNGASIEVPSLGAVRVGENNVIYAAPVVTFDKNNIGNYHF